MIEIEKDREGPSYTTDTLAELRRRRPGDEYWLLVGSDTVRDLHCGRAARLVEMAGLLVMDRPGSPAPDRRELGDRLALPADRPPRLVVVEAPRIDIASRDLRGRAPRDAASATSCRAPSSATSTTGDCTNPHRPSRKRERRCLHPSLTLPAHGPSIDFPRTFRDNALLSAPCYFSFTHPGKPMSEAATPPARPATGRSFPVLRRLLRLCAAEGARPWYPPASAQSAGMSRSLYYFLENLWLDGLVQKAEGTPETGPGMTLTPLGREVLDNPAALQRLREGRAGSSPASQGGVVRKADRRRTRPTVTLGA